MHVALLHQLLYFDNEIKFLIIPGERTFGVLTKLDLMDKGTNALEVSTSSSFECYMTLFLTSSNVLP